VKGTLGLAIGIDDAKTCNKVIFPGSDGSFRGIALMLACWSELVVDALGVKECPVLAAGFVVEALILGSKACLGESCV
jgi:hypothetical protein